MQYALMILGEVGAIVLVILVGFVGAPLRARRQSRARFDGKLTRRVAAALLFDEIWQSIGSWLITPPLLTAIAVGVLFLVDHQPAFWRRFAFGWFVFFSVATLFRYCWWNLTRHDTIRRRDRAVNPVWRRSYCLLLVLRSWEFRAVALIAIAVAFAAMSAEIWRVGRPVSPTVRPLKGSISTVNSVAFSPDGKLLAVGDYGDNTIRLWNVATRRLKSTPSGYSYSYDSDYPHSVAFSPDGKLLASGSNDYTVKLWTVPTGQDVRPFEGHTEAVTSIAFSPDGKLLASGSRDDTVKLWDVSTGQELHTLTGHTFWVTSVAFSPDGRLLASGSEDRKVILWNIATAAELRTLEGQTSSVTSVAFSPDSKSLASGSWDMTVKLWDVTTGQVARTFAGHTDWVSCVAFSPDGKLLASGSQDNSVILWDVATGEKVRTITGYYIIRCVAFSPDGKLLAFGSLDGTVLLTVEERE